jgi:hypothetical protein
MVSNGTGKMGSHSSRGCSPCLGLPLSFDKGLPLGTGQALLFRCSQVLALIPYEGPLPLIGEAHPLQVEGLRAGLPPRVAA